jgi:hypothetical protein
LEPLLASNEGIFQQAASFLGQQLNVDYSLRSLEEVHCEVR